MLHVKLIFSGNVHFTCQILENHIISCACITCKMLFQIWYLMWSWCFDISHISMWNIWKSSAYIMRLWYMWNGVSLLINNSCLLLKLSHVKCVLNVILYETDVSTCSVLTVHILHRVIYLCLYHVNLSHIRCVSHVILHVALIFLNE